MTSIAILPATAVSATGMPSYVTPGGAPSSAKAKRCKPAGAPSTAFGTGSAQSGVGPSANRVTRAPAGAATSTMTRRPPAPSSRRTDLMASVARTARRSEEHTSELQSPYDLVCRLLLEKKKLKEETVDD